MAKVIFASHHCCIRVVKEGLALIKKGVTVHFMQVRVANNEYMKALPLLTFYDGPKDFSVKLKAIMDGADLVHVHNEPDWIGHIAKDVVGPDVPVVFDAHDLNSIRHNTVSADEKKVFEVCDGFVFPSQTYQDTSHDWYELYKPSVVVHPYCLEEMLVKEPLPSVGGVVYEGGISGAVENKVLNYQNYLPLAEQLHSDGIPFFVYGGNGEIGMEYFQAGAIPMGSWRYQMMIQQMSRHHWGFVGPGRPHAQWNAAMPNKLFEYMAAGIPVIVWEAAEAARFVEEYGIGVVVKDMADIKDIYGDHERYRKRVMEVQGDMVMEKEIDKVLALYERVLDDAWAGHQKREGHAVLSA